jgi:hypothetical protein
MNGGWSKCKSLLAAVAVIIILKAVMVWKEPAPMLSGASSSISKPMNLLSLNDSTSEGINAIPSVEKRTDKASENNNTAKDVSKTATPQITPVLDDNDNYHVVSSNSSASELKAQKIQNYKDGKGIILNIHITHHAGTFLCGRVGKAAGTRGSPSFACMGVKPQDNVTIEFPRKPWKYNDTANNIELVRPFFHFISWEFGPMNTLKDTDWEHPNLVSVIVMREPISRLLAGDGTKNRKYPALKEDAYINGTEYEKTSGGSMQQRTVLQTITPYPSFRLDVVNTTRLIQSISKQPNSCLVVLLLYWTYDVLRKGWKRWPKFSE